MEVTVSGLCRLERERVKHAVLRLRGNYSSSLVIGRTDMVVVDADTVDWSSPKLQAAAIHGISVVPKSWIEDSLEHGFLLPPSRYALEPPQRSSAHSATATAIAATAPAGAAVAAAATAAADAPPDSPELLRGCEDASASAAAALPFLFAPAEPSPRPAAGTAAKAATAAIPAASGADELQHPRDSCLDCLPSPPASHQAQAASSAPSPSAAAPSPQQRQLQPLQQPPPSVAGPLADTLVGHPPHSTPVGAASLASPASDGSTAKLARFLRRLPQVTLARGGRMPRRRTSSADGSLGGGAAVSRFPPAAAADGAAAIDVDAAAAAVAAGQTGNQSACDQDSCAVGGSAGGGGGGSEHAPSESPEQLPPPPSLLLRMRRSLSAAQGGPPADTAVRLGPLAERPPAQRTLQGIAERHCGDDGAVRGRRRGQGQGEEAPEPVTFHSSAEALTLDGQRLEFVAGAGRRWHECGCAEVQCGAWACR